MVHHTLSIILSHTISCEAKLYLASPGLDIFIMYSKAGTCAHLSLQTILHETGALLADVIVLCIILNP